jgi:hypothetical protein
MPDRWNGASGTDPGIEDDSRPHWRPRHGSIFSSSDHEARVYVARVNGMKRIFESIEKAAVDILHKVITGHINHAGSVAATRAPCTLAFVALLFR